jgi:hypothetical protein
MCDGIICLCQSLCYVSDAGAHRFEQLLCCAAACRFEQLLCCAAACRSFVVQQLAALDICVSGCVGQGLFLYV